MLHASNFVKLSINYNKCLMIPDFGTCTSVFGKLDQDHSDLEI